MEYNILLKPLCGEPQPFVKSLPDIDEKSISLLDDSSRNCEQDKTFPMDENLPKETNSGKMGRLMHPKFLFRIHIILLVAHTLLQPKNMAKHSESVLLKRFMTMNTIITRPWSQPVNMFY